MPTESQFVRGGVEFNLELIEKLEVGSTLENIIVSPFFIQACMALAFIGSKGETAKEIATGMKYQSNSPVEVTKEFQNVLSNYNRDDLLKIANKIYIQQENEIKAHYATLTKEQFNAEAEIINFADSEQAAKTINDWVAQKTAGNIKELVSSDAIDANCSLVLLNAIHFRGLWKHKFNEQYTQQADFWLSKDEKVKLEFMRQEGEKYYAFFDEYKSTGVELPYKDSDLSMFVLLPYERDGLNVLAKKLKDANLVVMASQLRSKTVVVRLPKFKIEYSVELSKVLQEMGINKAFSDDADFSNILESSQGYHISRVIHKASIEVNEAGTEEDTKEGACAAATCSLVIRCLPPEFLANHPFFYWIWNRKTVFFAGAFTNAPAV